MTSYPWLTVLTLVPLFGGLVVAGLGRERRGLARGLGLGFMLLALMTALLLWLDFDGKSGELQHIERHDWIPVIGAQYFVAVDGLGLLMVLLTAFVLPFALLSSWRVQENTSAFVSLLLFLQAGLFGAFTALNFIHWFIFWELSLVPAYFLIKLWGGPQRTAAATQFFIYTMGGSVTLLLSFLAMYLATGTFDFFKLGELGRSGDLETMLSAELGWRDLSRGMLAMVVFAGVFFGFAVKVPVFPFHTWLPGAYTAAPTGVAMVLTGVMSKMGVYGFLRIVLPIFPEQMRWLLKPLLWLAVATIVASAFAAFAQKDLKRMIAYSSINHLGYCLLGIFAVVEMMGPDPQWAVERAAALNGVLLQMFNHGITASALFCFVGLIEQRSGGLRGLDDFGGLRKVAPVFCGLMGITVFASLGLPGLNGFVGEFLIFKGAFPLAPWAAAVSVVGLLVTAIFLLTLLQRVFHGPLAPKWAGFGELTLAEGLLVLPAVVLMFMLGVWPQLVIGFINGSMVKIVEGLTL